jgi:hypothetical protein
VGKKLPHLLTHLDPIYLNQSEKAADSNLLDGINSNGFLLAAGKAADADKLDNIDSTGFLLAAGKAADADKLDNLDSASFLQGATVYTRHFSCAGMTFQAPSSTAGYSSVTPSYVFPTTGGIEVGCNVVIPDGATVTRVDFTVRDFDATDNVDPCLMIRTNMATSIGTGAITMGSASTTGDTGAQRLSDTTISSAVMDNADFSYFLACVLEGSDNDIGLYGANVTYTITGTAGGG